GSSLLAEAIARLRAGRVIREAGYDGEYGVIRLFEDGELKRITSGGFLFEPPAVKRKVHGATGDTALDEAVRAPQVDPSPALAGEGGERGEPGGGEPPPVAPDACQKDLLAPLHDGQQPAAE